MTLFERFMFFAMIGFVSVLVSAFIPRVRAKGTKHHG